MTSTDITIGGASEIGWVGHLYLGDRGREVALVVGDDPVGAQGKVDYTWVYR